MDKKVIYQEKIRTQIKKANAKIYQLEAKAERVSLEDGIDFYRQVEKVKAMRDLLRLELRAPRPIAYLSDREP